MTFIKKHPLVILISLAVSAGILTLVWYVINRHFISSRPEISFTKNVTTVAPLSTVQVDSPVINKIRGRVEYYEKGSGKMYEVRPDGSGLRLTSPSVLADFISSIWSKNAQSVISSFSSPSGFQFRIHHFATKTSEILPAGTQSADFSPDGSSIVFFRVSSVESESGIFISDARAKNIRKIFSTRATSGMVLWPNEEFVVFIIWRPSVEAQTDVFLIDLRGGATRFLENQQDLEQLWSNSGKRVLFSLKNTRGETELWVRDFEKGIFSILPAIASASKCAWDTSEESVYCADPAGPSSTGSDVFFHIELATGIVEKITPDKTPGLRLIAEQLLLWPDETYLIVVNRRDGKLYSISLQEK